MCLTCNTPLLSQFCYLLKAQEFVNTIDELAKEFEKRFCECRQRKPPFQFTIDPFSIHPESLMSVVSELNIRETQLALLELQCDLYLSTSSEVNRRDCIAMWKTISLFPAYSVLCDVAKRVLSMFGSTCRCESAFSAMNGIKSKYRSKITDDHLVRYTVCELQPLSMFHHLRVLFTKNNVMGHINDLFLHSSKSSLS